MRKERDNVNIYCLLPLDMYGKLALARDKKKDLCSGYNPPVHVRNLQSWLERARDLELLKRGNHFGTRSSIPYYNLTAPTLRASFIHDPEMC
jgi:hypothetical protein